MGDKLRSRSWIFDFFIIASTSMLCKDYDEKLPNFKLKDANKRRRNFISLS